MQKSIISSFRPTRITLNTTTTFLQSILQDIDAARLPLLKDEVFVFPTKRGARYFKDLLLQHFKEHTFFSPALLSIEELMQQISRQKTAPDLYLIITLYDTYTQIYQQRYPKKQPLTMELFFSWGQTLLKDFDEIDKYLVNAAALYGRIYDEKGIESEFGANEEAIEAMKRFRTTLTAEEKTELMHRFLEMWQILGDLYTTFRQRLAESGRVYEGMLYSTVLECIKDETAPLPYRHFTFCGFNALSKAEETIFDLLLQRRQATAYWDADLWYMEHNKRHEAGAFLRRYFEKWKHLPLHSKWIMSDFWKQPKHIEIIGAPQQVAQAQSAALFLQQMSTEQLQKSALVLGDESLLMPLLQHLPATIGKLNITMGYSLRLTPIGVLAEQVCSLHLTRRDTAEKTYFLSDVCLNLLENPLLQDLHLEDSIATLHTWRTQTRSDYFYRETLLEKINPALHFIFSGESNAQNIVEDLLYLFILLFKKQYKARKDAEAIEPDDDDENTSVGADNDNRVSEYNVLAASLYQAWRSVRLIRESFYDKLAEMELKLLRRLLREVLYAAATPFEGNDSNCLQIMGFLETRTLDFEQVILLSANEGNLPMPRQQNSFIPFYLRKFFKMPTYEEQDVIFAYHFFRLLKYPHHITLLYNTEASKDGSNSEKSRFLQQLIVEYNEQQTKNSAVQVSEKAAYSPFKNNTLAPTPIIIEKKPNIIARLEALCSGNSEDKKSFLSPTALSSYLNCTLQFYFKYIARLYPLEEYENELNAATLGSVVHSALENLYGMYEGKILTAADIEKLKGLVTKKVKEALKEAKFVQDEAELKGRNLLLRRVIEELVHSVLDSDREFHIPFGVHKLEDKHLKAFVWINESSRKVWISGTMDRVDKITAGTPDKDTYRIVDYKTGMVKDFSDTQKNTLTAEQMVDILFKNPDFKANLQVLLYAWIYSKNYAEPVLAAVYPLKKKLENGMTILLEGKDLETQMLPAFEVHLKKVLEQLFDTAEPFRQTEDWKRCRYCDYREICRIPEEARS